MYHVELAATLSANWDSRPCRTAVASTRRRSPTDEGYRYWVRFSRSWFRRFALRLKVNSPRPSGIIGTKAYCIDSRTFFLLNNRLNYRWVRFDLTVSRHRNGTVCLSFSESSLRGLQRLKAADAQTWYKHTNISTNLRTDNLNMAASKNRRDFHNQSGRFRGRLPAVELQTSRGFAAAVVLLTLE